MPSVIRKEVTEYSSRPCAWSKSNEYGRRFVYYCYACEMEYNVLEDGKDREEIIEHIKTVHEDTVNGNNIHCDEGLVFLVRVYFIYSYLGRD